MQTPYGQECSFYYEDFNRGRDTQECRLAQRSDTLSDWNARLCKACPVPGIQRANSCSDMMLEGKVEKGFLGLSRQMVVSAYCVRAGTEVAEPEIGCGQCHRDNPIWQALEELE